MIGLRGYSLEERDYRALAARWIDRTTADAALLRRVDTFEGAEILGRNGGGRYEGICIPYVWPGDDRVREYRIRRDHPEFENGKPKAKYIAPPGRGNLLYFPVDTDPAWLTDVGLPLVITEGEFKVIALNRSARHDIGDAAERPRFLPFGVSGVWNWRGTTGKTLDPTGARVDEKGPIADLAHIAWAGRVVTIIFDIDLETNESVQAARAMLTRELQSRGAIVRWFTWPTDLPEGIKGIDDLLAAVGPERVLDCITNAAEQKPDARPEWQRKLILSENGNPKALLANALTPFRDAPEWRGVLSRNEFSGYTFARKPTPWGFEGQITEQQDALATEWLQHHGIFVTCDVAARALETVAEEIKFHPVRTYLHGLLWDGVSRLDTWLITYAGTVNTAYAQAVGAKWLISAVARVHVPGVKADHVLILEGPQGRLKSSALRVLADPWFTDELGDLGTKDAALQLQGVWIVELAELESLARPEISRVKAFISRTTDRFRPPYGRRTGEFPRQCVLAGTVNEANYLRDATGGRRFWPVACGRIDLDGLKRDRDQLWAEAQRRYALGEKWWLDDEELITAAESEQAARYDSDPWEPVIVEWAETRGSFTIEQVLTGCIDKPKSQWVQADKNRIARCLKVNGWERYRQRSGNNLEWRYRRVQ